MKNEIQIYPHNQLAYEKVCAAFETSNRTCVVHPTGTGKMYIAMLLIDDNADKNILYLTSYSTILAALDTEMQKCGVFSERLTATLYASLDEDITCKHYDYIIMDEFHRAGAEVWGTNVATLLQNNPQAKILGLSATPIRYLDNNRDMSDELFDGNVASDITLAEAVGTGILKMPKYVCAVYSLSEEFSHYEDRVHKMPSGTNKTEALALLEKARRSLEQADGLHEIFAKHISVKNGRYIVFCRNYEHMESMRTECRIWLQGVNRKIKVYEVRADRPDAINKQVLADFTADDSDKLKLLFAVDMLNEGVHASNVDGCIMLRPTESMNVYLQQLGRAISVSSKEQATVFDIVNNSLQLRALANFRSEATRAATESGSGIELEDFEIHESLRNFYDIISEIDALLSCKSWDEMCALAEKFFKEYGHLLVRQTYMTADGEALGHWVSNQRINLKKGKISAERKAKLDAIGMVWEAADTTWELMYRAAKAFYKEHGHTHIPYSVKTEITGQRLSLWVNWQRIACRNGTISPERKERLEAIGINGNERNAAWLQMYDYAASYFKTHGNLRVEEHTLAGNGKNLATWIGEQRKEYRGKKLSAERIKMLNDIGMVWEPSKDAWSKMYICAEKYFAQYGNLLVSGTYKTEDGKPLGTWIGRQRQVYAKNALSDVRIAMLNNIGMVWSPLDAAWNEMYLHAKTFYKKHGHLRVPENLQADSGKKLSNWLHVQRRNYRNKMLTQERQKLLEAIGIVWQNEKHCWEQMLNYARNYFNTHGNLLVPYKYIADDGVRLGRWIATQRSKYKEGKLPANHIATLESIGMVWSLK